MYINNMSVKVRVRPQDGFTLIEIMVVMVIIGILATIVGGSFTSSQQKGRDAKRKSELSQLGRALELYFNDHERYPSDGGGLGKIYACGAAGDSVCEWGDETGFVDENGNIYMGEMPADPYSGRGREYFYWSDDGTSYQLYADLENDKDQGLRKDGSGNVVPYAGTLCGNTELCDYGISSSNITPETNGR